MTFEAEWNRCAPWIEAALEHAGGTHDMIDVMAMVATREAQFWPGEASALVTTMEDFPRRKVLQLWLAGGDRDELVNILRPRAEAFGLAQGCSAAWIMGRQGWLRTLAPHGYAAPSALLMKDLT